MTEQFRPSWRELNWPMTVGHDDPALERGVLWLKNGQTLGDRHTGETKVHTMPDQKQNLERDPFERDTTNKL